MLYIAPTPLRRLSLPPLLGNPISLAFGLHALALCLGPHVSHNLLPPLSFHLPSQMHGCDLRYTFHYIGLEKTRQK